MDIFTDASLNDKTKIAGVGIVFVHSRIPEVVQREITYFSTDNIETAELYAISVAIMDSACFNPDIVRIFSDSYRSLRKLQHVFKYPDQNRMDSIDSPLQKKILYGISDTFANMSHIAFEFHGIHGHQPHPDRLSDGYYNNLADQEAQTGRMYGEQKIKSGKISLAFSDKAFLTDTDNQRTSPIVTPHTISFIYASDSQPIPIVRHRGRTRGHLFRRDKCGNRRG